MKKYYFLTWLCFSPPLFALPGFGETCPAVEVIQKTMFIHVNYAPGGYEVTGVLYDMQAKWMVKAYYFQNCGSQQEALHEAGKVLEKIEAPVVIPDQDKWVCRYFNKGALQVVALKNRPLSKLAAVAFGKRSNAS